MSPTGHEVKAESGNMCTACKVSMAVGPLGDVYAESSGKMTVLRRSQTVSGVPVRWRNGSSGNSYRADWWDWATSRDPHTLVDWEMSPQPGDVRQVPCRLGWASVSLAPSLSPGSELYLCWESVPLATAPFWATWALNADSFLGHYAKPVI